MVLNFNDKEVANLPLSSLSIDVPVYDRKWKKNENPKKVNMQKNFKSLKIFESLKKINTDNVVPTAHVTNLENSLREDVANKVLSHEEILSNAPQINSGQIKIPRVFDNE